jgi:hypothetical protein
MTIPRHGHRVLSGALTSDKTDRGSAVLNPKMVASQWKPGQSGNPLGRPAKSPVSDELKALLLEEYKGRERRFRGMSNACVLATRLYELALAGDLAAMREIADRVEGKVIQRQELGGPGGGAIAFMTLSREENERRIAELLAKAGGPDRDSTE